MFFPQRRCGQNHCSGVSLIQPSIVRLISVAMASTDPSSSWPGSVSGGEIETRNRHPDRRLVRI